MCYSHLIAWFTPGVTCVPVIRSHDSRVRALRSWSSGEPHFYLEHHRSSRRSWLSRVKRLNHCCPLMFASAQISVSPAGSVSGHYHDPIFMHIIQLQQWGAKPGHACSCTAFLYHISLHQEDVLKRIQELNACYIDVGNPEFMDINHLQSALPARTSAISDDHCCVAWITSHASLTHCVQESTFNMLLKHDDFPKACEKVTCVSCSMYLIK